LELGWWIVTMMILLCAMPRMISITCSESFEERPEVGSSKSVNVRQANHIEADVETFAFAAAQCLFYGAAHHGVATLAQAKLDQFSFQAGACGRVVRDAVNASRPQIADFPRSSNARRRRLPAGYD